MAEKCGSDLLKEAVPRQRLRRIPCHGRRKPQRNLFAKTIGNPAELLARIVTKVQARCSEE
jgi:hypothetical protein